MTSQLLVEMPAEGAARLLTLSLLEQLPQYASATGLLGPQHSSRYAVGYGATVRRLRASLALYADALGNGIPRKARRRLRTLQQAAERLYRADVQLAWCARHAPAPAHAERVGMVGDGAHASMWLCDRIARRRERARQLLQRAQTDSRALRRIAKRLGVYTTAVRLDSVTLQHSFARLTSDQIIAVAGTLAAAMASLHAEGSEAALPDALRSAEHLVYLLDPLRAYADVEEPSERLRQLLALLERLDHAAIVGRAIVRGGRRVAAAHTGEVLGAAIWPSPKMTSIEPSATNGTAPVSPADLGRGLLVLAEALHDEIAHALHELEGAWPPDAVDRLMNDIVGVATRLHR
jgi:hypothetical protein